MRQRACDDEDRLSLEEDANADRQIAPPDDQCLEHVEAITTRLREMKGAGPEDWRRTRSRTPRGACGADAT